MDTSGSNERVSPQTSAFGRRMDGPPKPPRATLHPSPAELAHAFRNEDGGTLRRIVLDRLYEKLTAAEKRLCDAERRRIAIA